VQSKLALRSLILAWNRIGALEFECELIFSWMELAPNSAQTLEEFIGWEEALARNDIPCKKKEYSLCMVIKDAGFTFIVFLCSLNLAMDSSKREISVFNPLWSARNCWMMLGVKVCLTASTRTVTFSKCLRET